MPGIRIGVQLASLRLPFKKALHIAARMNVDGVEIDARNDLRPSDITGTALRQVRKLLDDLNLTVVSVCFRTRRGYDCSEDLDRRITATKEAMRLAHDLGANVVVNQVGMMPRVPPSNEPSTDVAPVDTAEVERANLLRQVLTDLARYGQHIGTLLGCETGSEPILDLAHLIESIPGDALGITLNPGNLLINGFDLDELSKVSRHVVLVHAKDGVRDLARGRGTEVQLGRGLSEFPNIAAILEEHRFSGFFVVERELSQRPIDDVALAVEYLRNL